MCGGTLVSRPQAKAMSGDFKDLTETRDQTRAETQISLTLGIALNVSACLIMMMMFDNDVSTMRRNIESQFLFL